MKLYTGRGDAGSTDLFGGQRVGKDDLRVEAFGLVDELNSFLGLALSACSDEMTTRVLGGVQSRLFEIGADLATPRRGEDDAAGPVPRVTREHVKELEGAIDAACEPLAEMRHFVLPGGCELASRLHVARTACRRAERVIVRLDRGEPVGEAVMVYLNRLSDLLFALARKANADAGVADVPWISPRRKAKSGE